MSDYGVITEGTALRFERLLPGPIERVWEYLTDSEKRGTWLASGPMELRVGGKVELQFRHADLSSEKTAPPEFAKYQAGVTQKGVVTRCEPPRVLSYTWGSDDSDNGAEVTFELSPRDAGKVLLVITHRRLGDRRARVMAAGGWHAHLGVLEDRLAGTEPRPFWSRFMKFRDDYETSIPQ
ncbi:SRPBCC family protein [soil metagenome]